ncbi:hypothetical protein ACQP2U_24410 [Nocardia sp. CA-084685]|uniref:hypothetical protein n=1 Tax=Nocardia sp. CA-084685 TaxID=3239970 RepID=UPI003D975DA9
MDHNLIISTPDLTAERRHVQRLTAEMENSRNALVRRREWKVIEGRLVERWDWEVMEGWPKLERIAMHDHELCVAGRGYISALVSWAATAQRLKSEPPTYRKAVAAQHSDTIRRRAANVGRVVDDQSPVRRRPDVVPTDWDQF